VLIGVEHAPINMNDLYLIEGVYPVRPSLPSVVGNEGVGRGGKVLFDVDGAI
jgi:NADPH:quinone reductase-like Zn-dependent oxidoreductase